MKCKYFTAVLLGFIHLSGTRHVTRHVELNSERWIVMTVSTDTHVPKRMTPTGFWSLLLLLHFKLCRAISSPKGPAGYFLRLDKSHPEPQKTSYNCYSLSSTNYEA